MIEKQCIKCGASYMVKPYRFEVSKYCTLNCRRGTMEPPLKLTASERVRQWRLKNPGKRQQQDQDFKKRNPDILKARKKVYCENNKHKMKAWRQANKEKVKAAKIEWLLKNPESKTKSDRKYRERKIKEDPIFKMKVRLRTRMYQFFITKGTKKYKSTAELLGTDYKSAFEHIQSLFSEGMSWDNYGEWHIDHKKPLASGKTKGEIISLFHYTNLQPLWAIDNLKKSDKIL